MFFLLAFILGGIWGSFANVCIHRIPLEQSVAVKRSYCPSCKNKIQWFDNIPLISFILLENKEVILISQVSDRASDHTTN